MPDTPLHCLPRAEEIDSLSTSALRQSFLLEHLFQSGQLNLIPTDLDRLAVGAAMPIGELRLPSCREFGTAYFTERREIGIINIGAPGVVRVGAQSYTLELLECLYVGIGEPEISFESITDQPPAFYFLSSPAHHKHPTAKVARSDAQSVTLGVPATASCRRLNKCIHPGGVQSCQLVMGFTELEPSSVWNTMPAHTHTRRSEIYLYFDLGDHLVVHLFGEPENTRHLIVRDRQAILSPPWSLHSGAGTANYRFIWGMAGENQSFDDMDAIPMESLL
ncbi:MAG: 5-dehydro-4-deoxy-D-glucuronate isomerase [Bryobacterales bacterium]|nr:5-dehydro-4-deoxy-D-glucuronate isomerase [Bryobacterales bacterium]